MYYAELGYKTGFASFINGLIAGVVMIFLGASGFMIFKLRDLGLTTVPEFFEVKYSRRLRLVAGVLVAVGGLLNMGVFLKVEGTFLTIITGLPLSDLKWTMTAILLLELLYTVLGGMVSDCDYRLPAVHHAEPGNRAGDGLRDLDRRLASTCRPRSCAIWARTASARSSNPDYGWAYISSSCCSGWRSIPAGRPRPCAPSRPKIPKQARRCSSGPGFIFLGRGMMPMLWGIGALAYFGKGHDSLQAMPEMIARILPTGVLGLVVAGMLAATMSVNSSYLLGWSSVISQDIVMPLRRKPLGQSSQVVLNRIVNVLVSLFVLFWGVWYMLPGPVYFYLNITGTLFLAGAFAAFIGGLFWKRANTTGGYCAMIGGAVGSVTYFFSIPAAYAGMSAFALAALGMVLGSLVSARPPREVSPSGL